MLRGRRLTTAVAVVVTSGVGAMAALAIGGSDEEVVNAPGRHAPRAPRAAFALDVVARGLVRPTTVIAAPGDDGLWVTEQTGRVVRLHGRRRTTVLDLRRQVSVGAERGLLGLAFHPDHARNGRFVVNFTDRRGDTNVVEYRLGPDGRADARDPRPLLAVEQPEENHNGGAVLFATDGTLLVGMGDGGGAFDRDGRAQDPADRLGKILRADIDGGGPVRWTPLVAGVRNPWRIWIDPALNELWFGDVGQDTTEEVNRVPYEPDEAPKNLGWPAWEGDHLLARDRLAAGAEHVPPVTVYGHDEGCSVTGGLIYRGRALDALRERYIYGDFCTGTLWTLRPRPALAIAGLRRETARVPQLTSIGADADGELVFTSASGEILRAVRAR